MELNNIFLFDFNLSSSLNKKFTSASKDIILDGETYYHYSGLRIIKANFNDSANNELIISAIYDDRGISKNDIMNEAIVKIYFISNGKPKILGKFYCIQQIKEDLSQKLVFLTESNKYNKAITISFSKSCRANFGDDKCKVDVEALAYETIIDKIKDNIIYCDLSNFNENYFTNGSIISLNSYNKLKIANHYGNKLILANNQIISYNEADRVKLYPSCDKSYRTCCYSYNNEVNFRGEPHIPDSNILDN